MITVKLTDKNGRTHGKTQWGPNVTHEVAKWTGELCSAGVIHYYEGATEQEALALALMMNPIHGAFVAPRAWESVVKGRTCTDGTKSGGERVTTLREIVVPDVSVEQFVEAAIRVVLRVYDEPSFVSWAEKWLSGEDRSDAAASAADAAARAVGAVDTTLNIGAIVAPVLLPDYEEATG